MELKRIMIGAAIVAAGALGGWWLLFQHVPVTHGALQRACLEAHERSLVAAYIRLPDGMTAEEYEQMVRANCDCVAREALRQLPEEDLVAFARNQMTPEIYSRIIDTYRQCPSSQARQAEPNL